MYLRIIGTCRIAVIGAILSITGCAAAFDKDLLATNAITLETLPSADASFEEVRIIQKGSDTTVSGIIRYNEGRTTKPIKGHIHIEFLDPSGDLILQANFPYSQNIPGSTAYGHFEITIHADILEGSRVLIAHSPLSISDHLESIDPTDF